MKILNKMKGMILPLIFFLFICWLSMLANRDKQNIILTIGHQAPFGDKIGHFLLYGLLALLLNFSMKFKVALLKKRKIYLGSLLVLAFAILEEFSQLTFASRTFDTFDMVSDCLGVFFMSTAYFRSFLKNMSLLITKSLIKRL